MTSLLQSKKPSAAVMVAQAVNKCATAPHKIRRHLICKTTPTLFLSSSVLSPLSLSLLYDSSRAPSPLTLLYMRLLFHFLFLHPSLYFSSLPLQCFEKQTGIMSWRPDPVSLPDREEWMCNRQYCSLPAWTYEQSGRSEVVFTYIR